MAFKINNPFKSPLHNDDPALKIIENNKRIIQERRNQYQGLKDERQHVADARNNVKNVVDNALSGKNEYTLPGNDTIRQRRSGNPKDILGGKLVKKSTFDWLEGIDTEYQTSRPGCNSYACAVGGEAGMRVPVNEAGGVNIYEESANGGKGGNVWYASGDPMPIVPWNQRFDKRAKDLGFELQPEGTTVEAGDFIRQGYDEEYYDNWEYDDDGNEIAIGESRPGTYHSIIATDSVKNLGRGAYNSGDIYEGLKTGSAGGYGIKDSDFDADTYNRIQRYVGSVPYLENKFTEYGEDPNNKLQTWDTSSLEQPIAIPDPKKSIPDIKMPIRYTPDQIKKMKKESRKRNK